MDDLYGVIKRAIVAAWDEGWTHTDVPVLWRENEPLPRIDPITGGTGGMPYYFRNQVEFGSEDVIGFGGGRGRNFRAQRGSVVIRSFASVLIGDEAEGRRELSAVFVVIDVLAEHAPLAAAGLLRRSDLGSGKLRFVRT